MAWRVVTCLISQSAAAEAWLTAASGAAGQDGGHPTGARGEDGVADRADAAMDAVQAAGGDSRADRALGEPERAELRARHEPVLACGDARDSRVDVARDEFCRHRRHFSSRRRHAPEHAGPRRACGARIATIRARLCYAAVASMLRRT